MIRLRSTLPILFLGGFLALQTDAQKPRSSAEPSSDNAQLLSLSRKIDEQNTKIDLLSQQILRLQQTLEHPKATSLGSPLPAVTEGAAATANGSTHVVAPRETLTSIARMHKVGIDELQKLNHIENPLKLQIGQTLLIPRAQGAVPSPSPSASASGGQ